MKRLFFFAGLSTLTLGVVMVAQSRGPANASGSGLKPHLHAKLPPLDVPSFGLPRPAETIRETYTFAAEHPEVLSYMPCFCGCEQMGHRSNEDCFVKTRAKNGDVTVWEEHGISCAMCLAVAERAKQMYATGTALTEIRTDIERRYGHITGSTTPTPRPRSRSVEEFDRHPIALRPEPPQTCSLMSESPRRSSNVR